jgi:hypothetical protein
MRALQLIALSVFAALILYYARFFVLVRQEPATVVQLCLLLIASAIVVASVLATWRFSAEQIWAVALVASGSIAAIMVWADQGSHSVSDTLNRAVPATCIGVACVMAIASGRATSDRQALHG